MLMAFSIVSALYQRRLDGQRPPAGGGDAGFGHALQRGMFIRQAQTGQAAPRRPAGGNAPRGIFRQARWGPNDYVYLVDQPGQSRHWPRLLKLIGREELIGDARYDKPPARVEHEARGQ